MRENMELNFLVILLRAEFYPRSIYELHLGMDLMDCLVNESWFWHTDVLKNVCQDCEFPINVPLPLIVVCCRYREPRPPVLLKSELAGSYISQKFNIILLKPKDIISKNIRETKYILLFKNPISSNFNTTFVTFPTKLKKSYSSRFTGLNYRRGSWPTISLWFTETMSNFQTRLYQKCQPQ